MANCDASMPKDIIGRFLGTPHHLFVVFLYWNTLFHPIGVTHLHRWSNSDNFEEAKSIWKKFVPKSGQSDTVQGELLRGRDAH